MKRLFLFVPLISALFLIFASCERKYYSSDGVVWGTTYHIVFAGDRSLADSIDAVTERIDNALSLFNAQSELCAVNAGRIDEVGDDFARVYDVSRRVWALSGGVYDPTVGPLTRLWGFGPQDGAMPGDSAIEAALEVVGMGKTELSGRRLTRPSGLQFDFASVAKGYGVDCVADMLQRNGCTDFMVEIGGEIVASGVNPSGKAWRIQVDSPAGGMAHSRLALCSLGPERTAMAGSGNYRNFRTDSAGRMYGHTISPLTGKPVQGSVLAVTVVAAECALADALATACMASTSPDSALAFARRSGAEIMVAYVQADTLATVSTDGFPLI